MILAISYTSYIVFGFDNPTSRFSSPIFMWFYQCSSASLGTQSSDHFSVVFVQSIAPLKSNSKYLKSPVFLYSCIPVFLYVCMYVCMYICMYVCMDWWMDGWVPACMHACMYIIHMLCTTILYIINIKSRFPAALNINIQTVQRESVTSSWGDVCGVVANAPTDGMWSINCGEKQGEMLNVVLCRNLGSFDFDGHVFKMIASVESNWVNSNHSRKASLTRRADQKRRDRARPKDWMSVWTELMDHPAWISDHQSCHHAGRQPVIINVATRAPIFHWQHCRIK